MCVAQYICCAHASLSFFLFDVSCFFSTTSLRDSWRRGGVARQRRRTSVRNQNGWYTRACCHASRCGLFLCWANLIAACAAHSGRRTRGHSFLGALAHISVGQIEAEPLCSAVCAAVRRALAAASRDGTTEIWFPVPVCACHRIHHPSSRERQNFMLRLSRMQALLSS